MVLITIAFLFLINILRAVAYSSPNSTDVDDEPAVEPALPLGAAPEGTTVDGVVTGGSDRLTWGTCNDVQDKAKV